MSVNYKALNGVINLASNLGISRVSILRLVPQGRSRSNDSLPLSRVANQELRKIITDLKHNGHDIRLGSPYNFLLLNNDPQCSAGIDRISITPDLNLYPCDAFKQITPQMLGIEDYYSNLTHCSLQEAWIKSVYLKLVRDYLTSPFAAACEKCESLRNCLSGCLAQKFHSVRSLAKIPDPMCLKAK